ncbi:MAG TPA: glycosyltransferase family 2 protein [Burkholderiaceae bacterium]|nr:glycosyltransferase family 2 protein [Burkholderiaceae bacterium]
MSLCDLVGPVLLVFTLLMAIPAGVLVLQLVAALTKRAAPGEAPVTPRDDTLTVLMPAHDEAAGIAAAIAAVCAQLGPRDRLLVVADNCSDATAAIARAAGAEVTERADAQRRGKGYALDHGVRWLENDPRDPPGAVVIVDADCIVAPQALARLAQRCLSSARPVQALYLMHAPPRAPLGLRIAEFAWIVRNKVRPLGAAALGWPCQLMGTGMAFPWALIRGAPLATGHLVEDMQLGLDLAAAGAAPLFCPQALVSSVFPSDTAGARAQRTRWEHGHLSVIARTGPRLLLRALARRDAASVALALDLMVPPLAALVLALGALLAIDLAWWWFAADARPAGVAAVALALLAAAVLAAWRREARHIVTGRELLGLPLYVAAKIPVYVRLFTKRQVEWVRTKRDDRSH